MVSATRAERDLMTVPLSVSVVDEAEIEERYPGANTAEKLRDVAGVSSPTGRAAPGNNLMVQIRGQRPWRVLYLIDGISLSSVFREDINLGLLTIDPTDIERIEIIKGPASSLYGSEAIGGVVNIITKKGGLGEPFGGRIDFTYDGSNQGIQPHVAIYGDTEKWYYRASASYQDAGDRKMAKLGRADHSSFTTQSFFGNIGYKFDNGKVELTFNHYDSDVNEMTYRYDATWSVARYYPQDDPRITELGFFPTNRRDVVTGRLELYNLFPHLDQLSFHAYYQDRDTVQLGLYKDTLLISDRQQDLIKTAGLNIQGDFTFGSHKANLGFEYSHDELTNNHLQEYNVPNAVTDATMETAAVFVQDAWNIIEPLTLTVGLRQTWLKTSLDRFDAIPSLVTSLTFSNLVGNAGLVYEPFDVLSLRLQYSQGFRTPDLASKLTGTGEYMLPNYDLTPEKSESYEFGVRYYDGALYIDASVYYMEIKDYIKSYTFPEMVDGHWLSKMVNAASYKVKGFELATSWTIGNTGLTPYGSFSYLDGTIDYESRKTKNVATPTAWGTVGLRYDGQIGASGSYFADVVFRSSGSFIHELEGGYTMYRNRSGNTMDFSSGLSWGEDNKLKVVLSVKNLFDEEYQPAYFGYPGRHIVLSASYIF
jgi:hemoglobin/transferrin/lactoferrin receptor protein